MESTGQQKTPCVFISYCHSDQDWIIQIAERLRRNCIDVKFDIYEIKLGNDLNYFMETCVNDPNISHALIFCTAEYTKKANFRKGGVGVETQIISSEVYKNVKQTKFVPIICERDEKGNPFIPKYVDGKLYIDFSSDELLNKNWESLIRHLYNKPLYEKPQLGPIPDFIANNIPKPLTEVKLKFDFFKSALLNNETSVNLKRDYFIEQCLKEVDSLRTREDIKNDNQIIDTFKKLTHIRNIFIDWLTIELKLNVTNDVLQLKGILIDLLEKLASFRVKPKELNRYSNNWFCAHVLFVHEFVYYLIALLLKCKKYELVKDLYSTKYFYSMNENDGNKEHHSFSFFQTYGDMSFLNNILSNSKNKLVSPVGELFKINANREDISFQSMIEVELLIMLLSFIKTDRDFIGWVPYLQPYNPYGRKFDLFERATNIDDYKLVLAVLTGIEDPDNLRKKYNQICNKLYSFNGMLDIDRERPFAIQMNIDKLGTI